jgi:uncharacterized membrane protein YphA (DoxX/SURF4 family)
MNKYFTLRNLGWVITAGLTFMLCMSAGGKLIGSQEVIDMLESHRIGSWTFIIGLGEILALILFLIPRTMTLGALLLSAYFGGAIMFHMAHPDPAHQSFLSPAIFLVVVWVAGWCRGLDIWEFAEEKYNV